MAQLTSRQQAALTQMGITPLALRQAKAPLALICPHGQSFSQRQLISDVLQWLGTELAHCPIAVSEQTQPAQRYWVMSMALPATKTHLYSPCLDTPLTTDDKRRLWRSLQRWR